MASKYMSAIDWEFAEFNNNIKNHKATITQNGEVTIVRLENPDSKLFWFELVSWHGFLCITGDMGTYVFQDRGNMFAFFSGDFNADYWSEKLESACRRQGFKAFSREKYQAELRDNFDCWGSPESVWEDVKKRLLADMDDMSVDAAIAGADAYESVDGHRFTDFFERDIEAYTGGYMWCLRAISFGSRLLTSGKY